MPTASVCVCKTSLLGTESSLSFALTHRYAQTHTDTQMYIQTLVHLSPPFSLSLSDCVLSMAGVGSGYVIVISTATADASRELISSMTSWQNKPDHLFYLKVRVMALGRGFQVTCQKMEVKGGGKAHSVSLTYLASLSCVYVRVCVTATRE